MKRDLNAGIFESVKLQNDTKIDLLFPEICSRERYEGIATPSWVNDAQTSW